MAHPLKKRGRKPKEPTSDAETEPPQKKAKSSKAPLSNQDALPVRGARNDHPAIKANVVPPTHRTSKQVAAEHEAIQKAAKEKVKQGEAVKRLLAEMQVDEELFNEDTVWGLYIAFLQ